MANKSAPFLLLALSLAFLTAEMAAAMEAVPALFVFGDSILDVGNNNFLPFTNAKANYPHNGIDYPGRIPTGRFSNGYNSADFLAVLMGFNKSPPPFLSLTNVTLANQMFRGINFASGAAGIQDIVGQSQGGAISLRAQIEYFETVRRNMTMVKGTAATDDLLSKSFFLFNIGGNDFIEYSQSHGVKNTTRNAAFVDCLVPLFRDHLRRLHQLGARKFGIIGVPAIGCLPVMRSFNEAENCTRELNELAQMFHRATAALLDDIQYELEGMKYSFGNSYDMLIDVLDHPKDYGYKDVTSACCGDGRSLCLPNLTYCSNREEFAFWDAFHPTQNLSSLGASTMFFGPTAFVAPINFMQLVAG